MGSIERRICCCFFWELVTAMIMLGWHVIGGLHTVRSKCDLAVMPAFLYLPSPFDRPSYRSLKHQLKVGLVELHGLGQI
jgi:hypothetical protein